MDRYVDIFQVGARNMQNYPLLRELGKVERPVLIKRGLAATVDEWLMSAEYVISGGNDRVLVCERGVRAYETYTPKHARPERRRRRQGDQPPSGDRRSEPPPSA